MITVYGADWCEDTRRSQRLLRRLHVPHRYVNIDDDLDGLERAKALNHGSAARRPSISVSAARRWSSRTRDALRGAGRARDADARGGARTIGIQNVGDIERVARTTLGAALVAGAAAAPRPLRWPLRLAGVFAAATGIAGWCPAYSAAGVTSLGGPGDRPDEAERAGWLASRTSAAAVSDEGTGA